MTSIVDSAHSAKKPAATTSVVPLPAPIPGRLGRFPSSALGLGSDGALLLAVASLREADLKGRELRTYAVLTADESRDLVDLYDNAMDDIAGQIAGGIRLRPSPGDVEPAIPSRDPLSQILAAIRNVEARLDLLEHRIESFAGGLHAEVDTASGDSDAG